MKRSTPDGGHIPVLLRPVLEVLHPAEGEIAIDCTLGYGGHALELLKRVGPGGRLLATDLDAGNIPGARERLTEAGHNFSLHHINFAGLPTVMAEEGIEAADMILADLGMSSMQVDDLRRGFSYMRNGPLDMRMDTARGRTAADIVATSTEEELAEAFFNIGDEPEAAAIAAAIVGARKSEPIVNTKQLALLVRGVAPTAINHYPRKGEPTVRQQERKPQARVFQTLRILVNRELASLKELLRVLPWLLKPNGRAAIVSFHSGEDRLVKASFKEGLNFGYWSSISEDPVRADFEERYANPRSRSAKLRWAIRAGE